jgi:hypothetical protein
MSEKADKYLIQGNKLIIGSKEIDFNFPIDSCIEIEDMLIMLLSIPVNTQYNENVFGVSVSSKEIKWQIEKRRYIPAYKQQCPFVSIVVNQGELRLNNWCSVYFIVDPSTGKILKEGETR